MTFGFVRFFVDTYMGLIGKVQSAVMPYRSYLCDYITVNESHLLHDVRLHLVLKRVKKGRGYKLEII